MKKIIVSEIPTEGLQYELSELVSQSDITFIGPISGFLKVFKSSSDVIVEGVISASLELNCSRCLNNFNLMIRSVLNTVFRPTKILTRDDNYELHDDELDVEFYKNDEIDIMEFLIQEIRLNIPMKPLCDNDCKGICPHCGADLNTMSCNCREDNSGNIFRLKL